MYKGEIEILKLLAEEKKALTVNEISKKTGINKDTIRKALESLRDRKYVELNSNDSFSFVPTDELKSYIKSGELPEYSLFLKCVKSPSKSIPISSLSDTEKSIALRWAKVKGMVKIEGGKVIAAISSEETKELNDSLLRVAAGGKSNEELEKRNLLKKKTSKEILASYCGTNISSELSELERESGTFDISVRSENAPLGKNHPLTVFKNRVRDIFVEMGFEEMDGTVVESSFWNFDALFQPQDHPAREMADTFYLNGEHQLPDKKLVSRVKEAHEKGWGSKWSEEIAKKLVLRTHTTALSARYLAALANDKDKPSKKYFAVGRVFRNESTDFKHLAEFHQVEGIVVWEKATFGHLLGILKLFYSKLGFEKVRFVPSYFPYTEPSVEVHVYFEPKKQWMELGGAGIFRPEVSIPLCNRYPVLAWGLSLERPLMMLMDEQDIRTPYKNDLDWLKKSKVPEL
ncbi:MAG: phenylalanine--tRNA ligase subunit alpha [Candidatus Micrarchaeota archaeon]